jgi:hypothetical protein
LAQRATSQSELASLVGLDQFTKPALVYSSVDEMDETMAGQITPRHDSDPFYFDGHVGTLLYVPLIFLLAGVT